jgi:hypothetical protein
MPRGPEGERRPADVIGNAVRVMRIATGEETEAPSDNSKNKAAQELGRKGGQPRAKKLNAKKRSSIAREAALKRWER